MGLDGQADISISEEILQETLGIMRRKFHLPEERITQARAYIEAATRRVTPTETVDILSDSPDNRILECAQEAGAEYIVSGDKDLLGLKEYAGAKIVRTADFLAHVREQ